MTRLSNKPKNLSLTVILFRLFPIFLRAFPLLFVAIIGAGLLHSGTFASITVVTQLFFDLVTDAVMGRTGLGIVIGMAVAFGTVTIGMQVLNGLHNFMGNTFIKK